MQKLKFTLVCTRAEFDLLKKLEAHFGLPRMKLAHDILFTAAAQVVSEVCSDDE